MKQQISKRFAFIFIVLWGFILPTYATTPPQHKAATVQQNKAKPKKSPVKKKVVRQRKPKASVHAKKAALHRKPRVASRSHKPVAPHHKTYHRRYTRARHRHHAPSQPTLKTASGYNTSGYASWYGGKFNHRRTSSGKAYNMHSMTAASKVLPLGSWVKVTNLSNRRTVCVKITDRGPFTRGRIIDLSYGAAKKLGIVGRGVARVNVQGVATQG